VFQSYALYPHLSVADNIAFGLRRSGHRRLQQQLQDWVARTTGWLRSPREQRIADRVQQVAEMLDLAHLLDRLPKELSGGQKQRVALGRAIARQPAVFLMDEPLSNLDAKLRGDTRRQIVQLQRQLGVTTLYVTHDQVEAMTLADRVVVMNHGVVQQVGTPTEIYNSPLNTFVAGFIGSPAMNLLEGTISNGCFEAQNTKISGLKIEDGPVTLGFRAEDAEISKRKSEIGSTVYAMELLGDATMVTVKIKDKLVSVKADKNFRAEIGDEISFSIPAQICHLFDANTGARLSG